MPVQTLATESCVLNCEEDQKGKLFVSNMNDVQMLVGEATEKNPSSNRRLVFNLD